jgi:hypothetical protein
LFVDPERDSSKGVPPFSNRGAKIPFLTNKDYKEAGTGEMAGREGE